MRPIRWCLTAGCLSVCLTAAMARAQTGAGEVGGTPSMASGSVATRQAELEAYSRRFQRTPTTPNFGAANRQQPRSGQGDPLAFGRAQTRIHYRPVGQEARPADVDRRPLTPHAMDRSGIRDLELERPRAQPGDPLGFQRTLTTADRWRLQRESSPAPWSPATSARTPAANTPQTINAWPRSAPPARPRTYPRRVQGAEHSRFPSDHVRRRVPPATISPPAPPAPRCLTFNHDHVAPYRSVPARHGRTEAPSAARVSDRWFRRPPHPGMRP